VGIAASYGRQAVLGCFECVLQEQRDRQWPNAAGHRRQGSGHPLDLRVDVAHDQGPAALECLATL
jgi:hypothetical protein